MENEEEYLIDGISPEEWFESQARQNRPRERLTAEQYKERVQGAVERYTQRTRDKDPQIENYLSKLPERVRELGRAFCESFGRPPTKPERSYWLRAFNEQVEMGLAPEVIRTAMSKMDSEGLTIKSPSSVTAMAWDLVRKQYAPTRNKNIIRVGGGKDEESTMD